MSGYTDAFLAAFHDTVAAEGSFTDNPSDPGNWTGRSVGQGQNLGTKFGISAAAYPSLDIAGLTLEQAQGIYFRDYWKRMTCDTLPGPFAALVFDSSVNNGVGGATGLLKATFAAVRGSSHTPNLPPPIVSALCIEFQARRIAMMGGNQAWSRFGLGWSRRLCTMLQTALSQIPNGEK